MGCTFTIPVWSSAHTKNMVWQDNPTFCFVFNSNVSLLSAEMAAATLRKQFDLPCMPVDAIEHSFCPITSMVPGVLNTGANPDIDQVSCLLLRTKAVPRGL